MSYCSDEFLKGPRKILQMSTFPTLRLGNQLSLCQVKPGISTAVHSNEGKEMVARSKSNITFFKFDLIINLNVLSYESVCFNFYTKH